jgi:excisionase family DNA binding protein
MSPNPNLMNMDELLEYLPVKYVKGTIWNMVAKGEIKAVKFGRRTLFAKADIDKWIESKFKS